MAKITKKQIGHNIRTRRKKLGLSIEQLSEAIDISVGFLGLVERGDRGLSLNNLFKVSSILGCSIDELSGATEYQLDNTPPINILIAHTKANKCDNGTDIAFLINIMKHLNEYKKATESVAGGVVGQS